MDLIVEIHRVTGTFPVSQRYILSAQMQRAALSIASNIAEGRGRWGCREFAHGLSIANGSLKELETQVLVSQRLGFTALESDRPPLLLDDYVIPLPVEGWWSVSLAGLLGTAVVFVGAVLLARAVRWNATPMTLADGSDG